MISMLMTMQLQANIDTNTAAHAEEYATADATSNLESWNRLNNMVTAGSKGSKLNISQIMACCGQ